MLSKIRSIRNDALIKGSFILVVMIVFANLLNYIFQVSMARVLGPADYGILAVLMSIIYIFLIPNEAIQTVITKYTSVFNVNNNLGKIKDLLIRSMKKGLLAALLVLIIYFVLGFFLASFLKINLSLILLTGLFIFIVFTMPILRGILQGRKKFYGLGINMVIEAILKVILALIFIWIGWKVYGAMLAVIAASSIAVLLVLLSIKEILSAKREREEFSNLYSQSLPIIIAMFSIVLMYSIDIILARRFFSPQIAGEFAFVSLIGKVIVFVSSSIGKALFPLSAEEFEKGNKSESLLKKAVLMVIPMIIVSLLLYLVAPEFIIKLLSLGSTQYLGGASILFILGLSYSLISLTNIIVLYKLSVKKMHKSAYFLLLFVIIEIILLSIFNSNIIEFSLSILFSNLLMFLYSFLLIKK